MPIEIESPEQLGYESISFNLSESSVADRRLADLGLDVDVDSLLLCYGNHLGDPLLREAIASAGDGVCVDDVLVTPGAAAALFCTATALLEPGDHTVVVRLQLCDEPRDTEGDRRGCRCRRSAVR